MVLALELHFGARVLADEYLVTDFDREGLSFAVLEDLAGAYGDDQCLERFLFGGVGDEQAAGGLIFRISSIIYTQVGPET